MCDICPICLTKPTVIEQDRQWRDAFKVLCLNCGQFIISGSAWAQLGGDDPSMAQMSQDSRAVLSHMVWRMQGARAPEISSDHLDIAQSQILSPSVDGLVEQFVLTVGDFTQWPGKSTKVIPCHYMAKLGCLDSSTVHFVVNATKEQGYTEVHGFYRDDNDIFYEVLLTWAGWKFYSEIKAAPRTTNHGFMALPFPDPSKGPDYSGNIVKPAYEAFREGASEAGFVLENPLLARPASGNIIDHLKVEIRRAKFLVADLTGGNQGVYWEAGFAEGLGRKVIYTCEKSHFGNIHFDTKQMQTIPWRLDELQESAGLLRDILRNTFPVEARMSRDEPRQKGP